MTWLGVVCQRGGMVAFIIWEMEGLTGEMLARHYKISVRRSPRCNVYHGGYTIYSQQSFVYLNIARRMDFKQSISKCMRNA